VYWISGEGGGGNSGILAGGARGKKGRAKGWTQNVVLGLGIREGGGSCFLTTGKCVSNGGGVGWELQVRQTTASACCCWAEEAKEGGICPQRQTKKG